MGKRILKEWETSTYKKLKQCDIFIAGVFPIGITLNEDHSRASVDIAYNVRSGKIETVTRKVNNGFIRVNKKMISIENGGVFSPEEYRLYQARLKKYRKKSS